MSDQPEPAAKTTSATSAAPASPGLTAKSVALLLLAAAVIAGGVSYGVASRQNGGVGALKDAIASQQAAIQKFDATVASLRAENNASLDKLRAENSASLAGVRAENTAGLEKLRAENADLRSRLAAADSRVATAEAAIAKSQQRDPNAIYQLGAEVGRVKGAREDRAASTVTFEEIDGGNFDRGKEFEWRDLVLKVTKHERAMTSFTGRGVQIEMTGVQATIVRTRGAP